MNNKINKDRREAIQLTRKGRLKMKIERSKKELSSFSTLGKAGVPDVKRGSESSFDQELNQRQEMINQLKMREILAEIDKITNKLNRSINLSDLMLYKKLVRDFLREASSEAYQVSKRRGRNRSGRTVLVTVNTIDNEIDSLITEFRENKTEPMEILTALDKIRGMLLDLMI